MASRPKWDNPFYSFGEEFANCVTHGVGVALAAFGLALLLFLAFQFGDRRQAAGFAVYGSSLLILYAASTLYHTVQHTPAKRVLRVMDHASIYLLIAGTYTPFLLTADGDALAWPLLAVVWLMAAAGVVWKIFFLDRFEVMATLMYVFMGWMGVIGFRQMLVNVPRFGVAMLFAGGIVYTAGVLFYAWNDLPYNHAIWHVFVLAGSVCHYIAVTTLLAASA